MSRLDMITIGIVVVCLAALGYLVYKIVNLMNPPTDNTSITESYDAPEVAEDTTSLADNWDDEVTGSASDADLDDDELTYSDTDDAGSSDQAGSYYDDQDEMDTDAGSKTGGASTGSSSSSSTSSGTSYSSGSTASTGRYMVIAGSYQQRVNADNQAAKLRRLGYSETSVELFDRGSYAVVLVNRFGRLSEAKQLVSKLAGDGVEAFVKEKN